MTTKKSIFPDKAFTMGLILMPIAFGLHLFLHFKNVHGSSTFREEEGAFFINYAIGGIYLITTLIMSISKKWFSFSKYNYRQFICFVILMSISCFSLNIPFTIFSKFGEWVNIYLILMHISLIVLCFNQILPKSLKIINFFVLGLSAVMSFYFTVYLLPFVHIAFIGAIFFGLGLHLIIPGIMFGTIIFQFVKKGKSLVEKLAFYIGIIIPLIIVTLYNIEWNNTKKLIHKTQATIVTRPDNTLPPWVLMSQELGDDFFTERILKGDITYETHIFNSGGFFGGGGNSLNEVKEHDPLVVIGSEIMGTINLDRETRIKILESKYDLRHETKRKLWSGEHLTTTSILSNIQVFPDYRIAYTEKIIRIKNNHRGGRNRQEEALYTFHLPEGSVATSLSLWIDGKEEKSRLTTKSKADSAYTTIVGVERRDPSILHWQEGNSITVYVFPCTQEEERMFKIGITSPLKLDGDQLVLQNVYFEGPDASDALETSVVEFKSSEAIIPEMPSSFEEIFPNKFEYSGNYNSYWEASCNRVELSNLPFSFQGKSYRISESEPKLFKRELNTVYLDINKSWSKEEFNQVWEVVKDKKVFVYYDQLHSINSENKDKYFETLHHLNFSLFPFNKIKNIEDALLISKSPTISPMLKDLDGSDFVSNLKDYLENRTGRINVFSLSNDLSPYLKTLKEFQLFNLESGNTASLKKLIQNQVFVDDLQNVNTVKLGISNTLITRDTVPTKSKAPDHLLRLFAYNKIMQECGRNYFTSTNFVEDSLVDIANEAYIVSPISSLIVLETIKDYERFDINENSDSLKNASTQSAGAVPEPHEWALIILLSITLMFLYYKRKNNIKIS